MARTKTQISTEIKPKTETKTIQTSKKENKKTGNKPKTSKTDTNLFAGVDKAAVAEEKRLLQVLADVEPVKLSAMLSLIKRAAYLSATISVLEKDITANGTTELFTQSENTPPYERQRPNSQLLNSYNSTYSKIMKQLCDLLPKQETKAKDDDDDFDEFVQNRG